MNKKLISTILSFSLLSCTAIVPAHADTAENSVRITACADSYTQAYRGNTTAIDTGSNFGKNPVLKAANIGDIAYDTYLSGDSVSILNEKDASQNYVYPSTLPEWSMFNAGYIKYKLPYVENPENIDTIMLSLHFLSIGNDSAYWDANKSWIAAYPIGLHLVENNWSENTLTHGNHPLWKTFNIAETAAIDSKDPHSVSFDVTSAVRQAFINKDSEISFAFTYNNEQKNSYARPVNIASREAGDETAPRLDITSHGNLGLKENVIASVPASDDASVKFYAGDKNIGKTNYGTETVLLAESLDKTPITSIDTMNAKNESGEYSYPENSGSWSTFKTAYVKFPIDKIGTAENIYSTKLKLYFVYIGNEEKWNNEWKTWVKPGSDYVFNTQVHLVENNWNENELTYANHPLWKIFNAASPQQITSVDKHFLEFDITNHVKQAIANKESEISFAITYANMVSNDYAHPIAFAAKEGGDTTAPHLEIEYKPGYLPTPPASLQPYTLNVAENGGIININAVENKSGYADSAKVLIAEYSASDKNLISARTEDISQALNAEGIQVTLKPQTAIAKCFIWDFPSLTPLADSAEIHP